MTPAADTKGSFLLPGSGCVTLGHCHVLVVLEGQTQRLGTFPQHYGSVSPCAMPRGTWMPPPAEDG